MKIYNIEKKDGIEEKIKASASINLLCPINNTKKLSEDEKAKIVASINDSLSGQPDIYALNTILVSAGWNQNDDVFYPEEIWAAKDTPKFKQFNFMHDDTKPIGVITDSIPIKDGEVITELEDEFDIATSAIIYKFWSDPEKTAWIEQIVAEIDEGLDKWKVSMECIFDDFDYAIIQNGQHSVVERNEATAFLTKHLRAYGGSGQFQDYKIGRLLRSITFSGKGLVDNPANPRSVILKYDPFSKAKIATAKFEEYQMAERTEVDILKEEVAQLKAEASKAKKELEDKAKAEAEAREAEVAATLEEKDRVITELTESRDSFETQVAELTKERDELQSRIDEVEAEAKTVARTSKLVSAGLTQAEAMVHIEKYAMVDDDTFDSIVSLIKEKVEAEAAAKKDEDKKKMDDKDKESEASSDEDESVDSAEAEVGDDVDIEEDNKASASFATDSDEEDKAFSDLTNAFANSLKSTASLKKNQE